MCLQWREKGHQTSNLDNGGFQSSILNIHHISADKGAPGTARYNYVLVTSMQGQCLKPKISHYERTALKNSNVALCGSWLILHQCEEREDDCHHNPCLL